MQTGTLRFEFMDFYSRCEFVEKLGDAELDVLEFGGIDLKAWKETGIRQPPSRK